MEHVEYAYTNGMTDEAVEERLRSTATGVLSLSKDNDSYAVPLAHYYDGDNLYFRVGVTEGSKKLAFLEATETATYVLYETEATTDARGIESWSIIATGSLSVVSESERERFDTAAINERFSPIRVFAENIEDIEIRIYELDPDSITGRKTPESS